MEKTVDVWVLRLDRDPGLIKRYRQSLAPDELERAERLRSFELQADFIYTRGALRHILAEFAGNGLSAAELRFTYEQRGKPHLIDEHGGAEIGFNTSHSRDISVFAVARGRSVGIDVEFIRDDYDHDSISDRWFSDVETRMLTSLPATERTRGFFAVWSRKEAFVKALGTGISHRLSSFSVTVDPSEQPEILETYWDPSARDEWGIRDIPLPPSHAGAVVARGRDWEPAFKEWTHP